MFELRGYQEKAVAAGLRSLRGKTNDMIVAPTASGKSLIISTIASELNQPVLILQPSGEILEQNYEKLQMYGITNIGVYSDSMKRKDIDKYTYATIGSIYKCPELFKQFKHVIIDEAESVNPKDFDRKKKGMYATFLEGIGNPKVLGLTATPFRTVQKKFKDGEDMYYTSELQVLNRIYPFFFKKFCYNISIQQLYKEGYLAPVEYITHEETDIDISKLPMNTTGGDFDETALDNYMSSGKNIEKLVSAIVKYDADVKHNLIFNSSRRQARLCGEKLISLGYECEVITSADPDKDRSRKIKDFKSGKLKRLLNVGVLRVGFDFPELDCITDAQPNLSLRVYMQKIGRELRLDPANPNKVGKYIDTVGNHKRLGRVETIRMTKEDDGFRDRVESEMGQLSGVPLFTFKITKEETKQKLSKTL